MFLELVQELRLHACTKHTRAWEEQRGKFELTQTSFDMTLATFYSSATGNGHFLSVESGPQFCNGQKEHCQNKKKNTTTGFQYVIVTIKYVLSQAQPSGHTRNDTFVNVTASLLEM